MLSASSNFCSWEFRYQPSMKGRKTPYSGVAVSCCAVGGVKVTSSNFRLGASLCACTMPSGSRNATSMRPASRSANKSLLTGVQVQMSVGDLLQTVDEEEGILGAQIEAGKDCRWCLRGAPAFPPPRPVNRKEQESELMRRLGVGRTPIREAIQGLRRDGFVAVTPRRGTLVTEIKLTDLTAIYEVRAHLESWEAGLAAERVTPAERIEATGLIRELKALTEQQGFEAMLELDRRVHRFVYR